ncbi:MAG: tRNA-dihydrouridine synthase [bacterium]
MKLEDSLRIGNCRIPNRLFRAPLLECAGNGPDAVDIFIRELEPCAEAGVGLIFQGASIVRAGSGCAAPKMTRVHNPDFVSELSELTDTIHNHGSKIFIQLGHGGLRSRETWHRGYSDRNLTQLAVSELPLQLKLAQAAGLVDYNLHVLSTDEVYELAEDFGRSASYAIEAGYDGIHLSAANMSLIQQFLSPFYNRRNDEFGGDLRSRAYFLKVILDAIRDRVGDSVPVVTKVPAETQAPWFVRRHLSLEDGVKLATQLESFGYDALVPVQTSVFWDMNLIKGHFPDSAWSDQNYEEGYDQAFGGWLARETVETLNWLQSFQASFEPVWNQEYFAAVKEQVDVPVLAVGGIRTRKQIDALLDNSDCDLVGMGRPFYAEPKLAARLLNTRDGTAEVLCNNCNNCTIPQVTGAPGTCRTPAVMKKKAQLMKENAYET